MGGSPAGQLGKDFREEEMKAISWSELKKMSLSDIKAGECLKVTGDSETAFYAIINPQFLMRDRVEGICQQIDASRSK